MPMSTPISPASLTTAYQQLQRHHPQLRVPQFALSKQSVPGKAPPKFVNAIQVISQLEGTKRAYSRAYDTPQNLTTT
jgi:hypothetical protein